MEDTKAKRRPAGHWKPFVIRDPVHGYLEVAAHERLVIDHPITQRLRRINQTGAADLVFPEARTSRFAHSLGAMHLASKFVLALFENAELEHARDFFDDLQKWSWIDSGEVFLSDFDEFLLTDKRAGGGGLISARANFRHAELRDPKYKQLLALVESSVRLAALFHDLGHMPYSHDFEGALKQYSVENAVSEAFAKLVSEKPHEVIGHKLAEAVFTLFTDRSHLEKLLPDRGASRGEKLARAVRAAFALATEILNEEANYSWTDEPQVTYLAWLHSIVDGEIDVDRADYLLRDGRALGLEFAEYDLPRLINNLVLWKDEKFGFITAVDERGFTALESYFVSRARSNQVLVRHHKSAQVGVALRYCTAKALQTPAAKTFVDDLEEFAGSTSLDKASAQRLLDRFATYDDAWWIQVLRSVVPSEPILNACLALIVQRQPAFLSYWKRKGQLSEEARKALRELALTPALYSAALKGLEKQGILMAIHKFSPFKTAFSETIGNGKSIAAVIVGGRKLLPASELSKLLPALEDAWNEDVQAHAFGVYELAPDWTSQVLIGKLKPADSTRKRKKKPGGKER